MSGSKQSGTSTTVQSSAPWSGQQPYLEEGFKRAKTDILEKPISYYPHSTVVPFAPQTQEALQMGETRARAGSPLTQGAQEMVGQTVSGEFLGANPYLNRAVEAATRPMVEQFQTTTMPAIQSGFGGRGRYGSGLQAYQQRKAGEGLTRQIGDVAGSMAFRDYGDERQRMMQAAQMAPGLAEADYSDISKLQQIGGIREAQAGAELEEDIARYMHAQQAPQDALQRYMSLVAGGSYGGDTTTQQPIYRNRLGEALGTGATLAGIGGTLFGQGGIWPS
jgi:hypothetical protein